MVLNEEEWTRLWEVMVVVQALVGLVPASLGA